MQSKVDNGVWCLTGHWTVELCMLIHTKNDVPLDPSIIGVGEILLAKVLPMVPFCLF